MYASPRVIVLAAVVMLASSPSAVSQEKDESDIPAPPAVEKKNPYTSEADVRRGRLTVRAYCSVCHGPEGKGGRGPDLTSGNLRRGNSNEALLNNIKNGIPGTDMVGVGDLGDEDQSFWQVISYIRDATKPPPPPPQGSKEEGRKLVVKHNCTNCHWIEGKGGRRGPDLGASGASAEYVRESIVDPDANFREQPSFQHNPYQRVLAITVQGTTVEGRWLNENGYFIQVIDDQDRLRTLRKEALEELVKPSHSLMPTFAPSLSDKDLEDLIAYLFSLRPVLQEDKSEEDLR